MKPTSHIAAAALIAAVAVFGAVSASAQGFASYDAYLPTHEYYGYTGYAYRGYAPSFPEPRYEPGSPRYSAEYPAYSGWRRGERLPVTYREDVVDDYASVHLGRPARGLAWYHDADDYILASARSGLIYKVVHAN
jgi:Ni/Co efflux regulator RcnB